jgi:hypothetical protein
MIHFFHRYVLVNYINKCSLKIRVGFSVRSLQCLVPNFTLLFSTSLLNVNFVQTNKPKFCQNVSNFNCGLSDYHNMISFKNDKKPIQKQPNKHTHNTELHIVSQNYPFSLPRKLHSIFILGRQILDWWTINDQVSAH